MYLQTAMYVIKSYLGWITKGKPLNDSVKYLSCFDEIREMKFEGKSLWKLQELKDVVLKTLSYIIELVGGKMAGKKEGESEKDVINYQIGIRLQQLAQLHAVFFVIN